MDGAKPGGTVFAHSCHQHGQGLVAKLRGNGMKEYVDGGTVPVDPRLIDEDRYVSVIHTTHFHVTVAWADQGASSEEQIT
jgi:hypothetical protein